MKGFNIDWNYMKKWPMYMWVIFLGLLLLIGTIILYIFFLYSTIGFLTTYIYIFSGIISTFSLITYKLRNDYDFHFHHYTLGMVVMVLTCYQNGFVTVVHAVFNGLMISGAARWGYDPIWIKKGLEPANCIGDLARFEASRVREENFKK